MPKHKLYILRWNPTFSMKYESHLEGMRMLKNNPITNDWSIYEYEELKEGDFFIFNMVGMGAQDGIAGFGVFVSEPSPAPNWKANDGTMRQYADFEMYCMIDRKRTDIFSAAEMEAAFPDINWHGGHAGVPVDSTTAERLILYIMQRTLFLQEPTSKISFPPFNCPYPLAPFFAECIEGCCPQFKEMIIARNLNNPLTETLSPEQFEELKTHIIPDERIVMTDIYEDTVITPSSTLEQIADCFITVDINDYNDYFDDEDGEEEDE